MTTMDGEGRSAGEDPGEAADTEIDGMDTEGHSVGSSGYADFHAREQTRATDKWLRDQVRAREARPSRTGGLLARFRRR